MILSAILVYYAMATAFLLYLVRVGSRRIVRHSLQFNETRFQSIRNQHQQAIQSAKSRVAEIDSHQKYYSLLLTLSRNPQEDSTPLAVYAALLIHKVNELDLQLGGSGVRLDPASKMEGVDRVELRLLPKQNDSATPDRFRALVRDLNRLAERARLESAPRLDSDIHRQIAQVERDMLAHLSAA